MRKILFSVFLLLSFVYSPAFAQTYFGFRLDLAEQAGSTEFHYKLFAERELLDLTLFGTSTRVTAGVEVFGDSSNSNYGYLTFYTGYEVDINDYWIQFRIQSDAGFPGFTPRFTVSMLGGFYIK